MKKRTLVSAIVIFAALMFPSCRLGVRFAYNRADWFIMRQLSDFACLTNVQRDSIEAEISGFMAWHRKEELPIYAKNLRDIATALEKGTLSKEAFENVYSFFQDTGRRTGEKVKDFGIEFVMSMPPEQIECSFENFEKRSEERKKELEMSEKEFREKRRESLIAQTRKWLGSITEEQIALIDVMIPPLSEEKEVYAASQRKFQHTKKALMMPDSPQKRDEIVKLIEEPYALYTEREKNLVERRREQTREALWKLSQTLTERQRANLARQLNNYAKAFEDLSRE